MDARLVNHNAEVVILPGRADVTTLGTPDPVWRDLEANVTGIGSTLPPREEKGERPLLHPMAATGPSRVSIWPSVRDAKVAVFPIWRDAKELGTLAPIWRDLDVPAIDWILLPVTEKGERQLLYPVAVTGPAETNVWPSALDVTEDGGDDLAMLEIIAEMGDEAAFVQAVGEIDWPQRSATDFSRAVHSALAAGAHLLARRLADYGHRLYPHHGELAKMAQILAPPRMMRANLPPDPSVRVNLEWMHAHAIEYQGQWVALKDGVLLASAPNARELKDQLLTTDGLFLTRVI
jgi:hypothetical protein